MKVDPKTLTNYCALLAHKTGVSLCNEAITKTAGRYTAENILISAVALLCVVAATLLIEQCSYLENIPHCSTIWSTGYYWFSADGQTIELENMTISHGGRYTCTADNGVGDPVTEQLHVTVLCKYSNKSVTAQIKTFRTITLSWKSFTLSLSLALSLY